MEASLPQAGKCSKTGTVCYPVCMGAGTKQSHRHTHIYPYLNVSHKKKKGLQPSAIWCRDSALKCTTWAIRHLKSEAVLEPCPNVMGPIPVQQTHTSPTVLRRKGGGEESVTSQRLWFQSVCPSPGACSLCIFHDMSLPVRWTHPFSSFLLHFFSGEFLTL